MRRRDFIGLIAAWPVVAHAQRQHDIRQIGFLSGLAAADPEGQARISALRRRLQELGWSDGTNVYIFERWAAGDVGRTRSYAQELASLAPDVIVVNTPPGLEALQKATRTVPIVFVQVVDASESELTSFANPAGNVTGFYNFFDYAMSGKWLQLLKELAPRVTQVGVMQNPEHPAWAGYMRALDAAAQSLGVEVIPSPVRSVEDIDRAVERLVREPNGGLLVLPDSFTAVHRHKIVALAARYHLPGVYPLRYFADVGGVMSYGADLVSLFRHAATYVDRILRNARPGDLPVQQSSKFELVINLKAARAAGMNVPASLLARADEVIE